MTHYAITDFGKGPLLTATYHGPSAQVCQESKKKIKMEDRVEVKSSALLMLVSSTSHVSNITHRYEDKSFRVSDLGKEVLQLKNSIIHKLMKLKHANSYLQVTSVFSTIKNPDVAMSYAYGEVSPMSTLMLILYLFRYQNNVCTHFNRRSCSCNKNSIESRFNMINGNSRRGIFSSSSTSTSSTSISSNSCSSSSFSTSSSSGSCSSSSSSTSSALSSFSFGIDRSIGKSEFSRYQNQISDSIFLDLGSGRGHFCRAASCMTGIESWGIEYFQQRHNAALQMNDFCLEYLFEASSSSNANGKDWFDVDVENDDMNDVVIDSSVTVVDESDPSLLVSVLLDKCKFLEGNVTNVPWDSWTKKLYIHFFDLHWPRCAKEIVWRKIVSRQFDTRIICQSNVVEVNSILSLLHFKASVTCLVSSIPVKMHQQSVTFHLYEVKSGFKSNVPSSGIPNISTRSNSVAMDRSQIPPVYVSHFHFICF